MFLYRAVGSLASGYLDYVPLAGDHSYRRAEARRPRQQIGCRCQSIELALRVE
jgi:hypothetical protein